MPIPLFTNNAATSLALPITPTDTTIQVVAGTGQYFPSPTGGNYFMLTLIQINNPEVGEIVQCTARAGDILTVVRGREGTAPQIFNISDNVELRITAGSLNLFASNSNPSYQQTNYQEYHTATAGQTVFPVSTFTYTPGTNSINVYVNGSKQIKSLNYTETSTTSVTFLAGLNVGDIVEFTSIQTVYIP